MISNTDLPPVLQPGGDIVGTENVITFKNSNINENLLFQDKRMSQILHSSKKKKFIYHRSTSNLDS